MKNLFLKNNIGLKALFFMSFLCFGLYHEFTSCLFLSIEVIYLIYLFKKKNIEVFDNLNFIFMILIIFMYLFVVLFAIDRGMALIGFFKQLVVLFFIIILMQFNKEDREELLLMIPSIGIIMVLISFLSYFIANLNSYFIVNNRIGGFFQYPNTLALFLLIGCIVLFFNKKQYKYHFAQLFILLLGIILTGSRTIYVFTFIVFICFCIKDHEYLKFVGICSVFFIAILAMTYLFNIHIHVLDRFQQFSLSSSTLLGRVLYDKDGLKACLTHPLGLGYLGYYYLEPSIQTGVYSIRFIHNDILQIALDIGIVPCLLFIFVIINSFISKRTCLQNKMIILVIILHLLFDFNLQFLSIYIILTICLDLYTGKKSRLFSYQYRVLSHMSMSMITVISLYVGITLSFHYFGYTDLSIQYLPIYTEAKTAKLETLDDIEEAMSLAKSIEKYNTHVSMIYDVYALHEMQQNNFDQMMYYKDQSLELQKYNINEYDNYINMLYIAQEASKDNESLRNKYIEKIKTIPNTLKKIKENTDNLAYKIYDKPDLELSSQSQEIIKYAQNIEY